MSADDSSRGRQSIDAENSREDAESRPDHGSDQAAPTSESAQATDPPPPTTAATAPSWLGRLSVRVRLVILLVSVTIPVVVAAVLNTFGRHEADLEAGRRVVGLFADVILREQATVLAATRQMLTVLSQETDGAAIFESAACSRKLASGVRPTSTYFGGFFILDGAGRLVCSTTGTVDQRGFADSALLKELQTAEQYAVTLSLIGPLTGQPALVAAVPLAMRNSLGGAVGATMLLSHFANLPGYGRMPEGTAVWVMDRAGATIINIVGGDTLLPQPIGQVLRATTRDTVFDGNAPGGARAFYAIRPLTDGISLMVGAPAGTTISQADADAAFRIAQIALLFGLSVLTVTVGAHYAVLKPLRTLGRSMSAYGGVDAPFVPPSDLPSMPTELRRLNMSFVDVTNTVSDRETRLKELVAQRDLLVREIHHRVKNNLQIISSLLNLQAQRIRHPAAQAALYAARERVASLALLHRHIYMQPEAQAIDFKAFLEDLIKQLSELMEGRDRKQVRIELAAPRIRLESDQVVPLGLIVTEVITNAFKYGFANEREGTIHVALELRDEGRAELSIRNDGTASAPAEDDHASGLGSVLISGLAQQLGAEMEVSNTDAGYEMKLTFPIHPI